LWLLILGNCKRHRKNYSKMANTNSKAASGLQSVYLHRSAVQWDALFVPQVIGANFQVDSSNPGTMNLLANLTAGEILEQLHHANRVEKIRNVVFMGMGEPLDNYNAVLAACQSMHDPRRFGLSSSHITVSTVGVVPRMHALCKDLPNIVFYI
jgi:adenine C2-methylase RlmN of 23S rRNA A2503 and tRNA A37